MQIAAKEPATVQEQYDLAKMAEIMNEKEEEESEEEDQGLQQLD